MKINVIILAAGDSKRFNGNKLLSTVNEKLLFMHTLDKIFNINNNDFKFNKIVVVSKYKEIFEYCKKLKFEYVENPNTSLGISHSIKLGVNKDIMADGYMFMVCDQPYISENNIIMLINSYINNDKGICSLSYNGEKGNPNIFDKKYLNEICQLTGDVGGKKIINNNIDDSIIIEIDDQLELIDIDVKEDIEK